MQSSLQAMAPQDLGADLGRRNAELAAQVGELTRALQRVEAVSQLTAGIVHDVRNALHVVLGEAELLASSLREPEQRESAKAVLLAGSHADAILRDLLALARKVEAGTSLVNGEEVFARCRPLIQRIARQRLECVFTVDQGVWPVAVEPQQLEAALINLTANARDAMPHGGRLCVTARNLPRGAPLPPTLPPGEYVGFSVQDTGVGLTPQVLARATEAFFTTKEADRGTGLGLSMVQAFATRSGGAIQIESEPDRGTRVEILLPRAPLPAEPIDNDPEPRRAVLQKIRRRVRTGWLRDVLEGWRAACPKEGLPRPVHVEAALIGHVDCSLVLAVEQGATPPVFRLVRMGDALGKALGGTALGELALDGPLLSGSQGAAYRRALRSRFPSYEYAHYSFGDGSPAEVERMILPAAADGETVSHLIGVVVLSIDVPSRR